MVKRYDYEILYPGRLAHLMQTSQGPCLGAYAMVAWKRGVRNEQRECRIAIEFHILDVGFPMLFRISNSMAERISVCVAICSYEVFGHCDGAVVLRASQQRLPLLIGDFVRCR